MPPAIAIAAAWAGSAVAAAIGLTGLAAALVGGVIAMGINSIASSLFGFDQNTSNASQASPSLTINSTGATNTIPVVYGNRRVGGSRVFIDTTGNNQILHLVYAMCEGPVTGIGRVYFNNAPAGAYDPTNSITDSDLSAADANGWRFNSKFAGYCYFEFRNGTDDQTSITALTDAVGSTKWSTAHQLKGVAYMYVKLTFNKDVYSGLPTITADITGRTVPTAHVTAGWATTDYNNPAWVLYDYLTNNRYGKGITPSMIDMPSFLESKAYCNELVDMLDKEGATITQKRYVADGHVDTGLTMIDNVKNILTSMNGFMIQSGGRYKLKINQDDTPAEVFDFNEGNITGSWDIQLGSKTNRFNQVKTTYFEPDNNYQGNIILLKDSTYLADDAGNTYERELTLPLTCNYNRAGYISRIIMNQSRFQTTVSFLATPTALVAEVGDIVSVTHPVPDWQAKLFRVMNVTIQAAGDVRFVLAEFNPLVYTTGTIIQSPDFTRQSTYQGTGDSQPDAYVNPPVGPVVVLPLATTEGGVPSKKQVSWTRSPDQNITSYQVTITGQNPQVINNQYPIIVYDAPQIDAAGYVSLLLHGDGTNNSTTIVDSSLNNFSPSSIVGSARVSTNQSKFGGTSLYFPTTSRIVYAANSEFVFGTGDFCVECWVYVPDTTATRTFVCYQNGTSGPTNYAWALWQIADRFRGDIYVGGTPYTVYSPSMAVVANTWQHLALVRNGTNLRIYVNGVATNVTDVAGNQANALTSATLNIGSQMGDFHPVNGYIDELRISKTVPVYTANFTPATSQFATGQGTDYYSIKAVSTLGYKSAALTG